MSPMYRTNALTSPSPTQPLRRESEPSREQRLRQALLPWLAGLVTVALLSAVTIAWQRREDRALRDMPAAQRHALYERAMQTLQGPCSPPGGPASLDGELLDHCRHEAELLRRFPECGGACEELASRFLEQPSR